MKRIVSFLSLFCCAVLVMSQEDRRVVSYNYTNKVVFSIKGNGTVNRFVAYLPVPQTNEYQQVWRMDYHEGTIVKDKNYGNQMLYVDRASLPQRNYELGMTFDYIPISIKTDFTVITTLNEYDPHSYACQHHLGDRGDYIVTSNPQIQVIGDQLWAESSDVLDYARKCYEYVASHFSYLKSDWRTLEQILIDGGGGSGDFTTLVVNLLRYKGIPSRHNICITLDENYHVFADFYLEGYGWIPLDATYKHEHPEGDYFGVYDGNCIVLGQDILYDVDVYTPWPVDVLQTFEYYYIYSDSPCAIYAMTFLQNNGVSTANITPLKKIQSLDERNYNLQGQQVSDNYKGFVISNGRKSLRK